jgi:HK97 family phage portal protein
MGLFKKRAKLPPYTITTGPLGGPMLPTWAGTDVNTDAALRHNAVWACVRLLADTVSTLPIDVYRRGEREPIATPPILVEPAAGQPIHEWLYSLMVSLLLRGNAYGVITARQGATMLPAQTELIHPDKVGVLVNDDGQVLYRILGRVVDRADVFHAKAFTMPGAVAGLSPVEYARQAIGLGVAAEKYGARFFGDDCTPSGLLTTADRLTVDQVRELAERWNDAHRNTRTPAVLSGDLKFSPISVSPEESQFLETAKFNLAQICRVYGVPVEMVSGESGNSLTYANVEGRLLDFLKFSLNPWLVRLENALGRLLPSRQFVKFNTGGLLKADTATRYAAHKIALDAGFMTVNEVRELEDRPPLPGGDTPPAPSGNGNGTVTKIGAVA